MEFDGVLGVREGCTSMACYPVYFPCFSEGLLVESGRRCCNQTYYLAFGGWGGDSTRGRVNVAREV